MKERVLITGASGFVGYHLIEAALRKGLDVYAAVRATSKISHLKALPINFNYTNFSDREATRKDLEEKQYDYIIHAAGAVKAHDEIEYNRTNAEFTRTLGIAIAETQLPLKKFVFISSLAALGPSYTSDAITEIHSAKPLTYYGKSKLLAEHYLSSIPSLPTIVLRPTVVYGPRERDIFIILKSISHGIEPYIGSKAQQLSFVYVKDLAEITIDALHSHVTRRSYNVSDGQCYDRYALADLTKFILQKQTYKVHIPKSVVQIMAGMQEVIGNIRGTMPALNRNKIAELTAENWVCSIDSISQDLGYVPRYDLKSGLTETIQWYKENEWLKN